MGIFKEMVKDYAVSHYHTMPKSVQKTMLNEGKKVIEKEHPIISNFMSEKTKEKLVENYFTKKEVERYKKQANSWNIF